MSEIVLARQEIVDSSRNVQSYELLNRDNSNQTSFSNSIGTDDESSLDLLFCFNELGHRKVLGDKTGFFNVTPTIMMNIDSYNIPKGSVLELMEFDIIDDSFKNAINKVKSKGYLVALDDFLYSHLDNELIDYIDVIKVDYIDCTAYEIDQIVERLNPLNKILLAEKVETEQMFAHAVGLGFTLFQGYLFHKPEIIT